MFSSLVGTSARYSLGAWHTLGARHALGAWHGLWSSAWSMVSRHGYKLSMVLCSLTWSWVAWHNLELDMVLCSSAWFGSSTMLGNLLVLSFVLLTRNLVLVSIGAELSMSQLLSFNLCMGYLISVVANLWLNLY